MIKQGHNDSIQLMRKWEKCYHNYLMNKKIFNLLLMKLMGN